MKLELDLNTIEGYVALKHGRRFDGCELKEEYHAAACKNLATAEAGTKKSAKAKENSLLVGLELEAIA